MIKYKILLILMSFLALACRPESQDISEIEEYSELYRPQFHFSPPAKWMNDPNGMVYFEEEYHLFYQYYPDSTVWGPMHWGHAVSKDLVSWEHLPVALYPDSLGYIFSGSAVIDWNNTSGLGSGGKPPMIAIFTHHDMTGEKSGASNYETQSIAYSNDRGRNWTKYSDNPVIPNPGFKDFRDPKVSWSEEYQQWIMVLAVNDHIKFYVSGDLKDWKHVSDFGKGHGSQARPWECPDFILMKVEGTNEEKWILIVSVGSGGPNGGSGTQYFIGDFDGTAFKNNHEPETTLWIDYGKDNYAGVTWSDLPDSDDRKLFIGWMSNWQYAQVVPTNKWRSAMTLPRQLKLLQTTEGLRLFNYPVEETVVLRMENHGLNPTEISGSLDLISGIQNKTGLYELHLEFVKPDSQIVEIVFSDDGGRSLSVGYDPLNNQYFVDRTFAGQSDFSQDFAGLHSTGVLEYIPDIVALDVYIDHSSIEVFADGGRTVLTEIFFPSDPLFNLEIRAPSGGIELVKGEVYSLKSIWAP